MEVLIAVVILSIGLLGIAGLQIKGLRGTHNSNLRSQATFLANDLAERMRANPLGITDPTDGSVPQNSTYANVDLAAMNCSPNPAIPQCINNLGAPCDVATMTRFDLFTWMCGRSTTDGVRNLLPLASATVSCADLINGDTDRCNPGSTLTIQVGWGEPDASTGTTRNQTVELLVVP